MSYETKRFARAASLPLGWAPDGPASVLLSIIVPVKDEEVAIAPFVARVAPIVSAIAGDDGWEILFVDDGSTDTTLARIARARATNSCRRTAASARAESSR